MVPVTDEQAKAVQEAAKLGSQSLELARDFSGWVGEVLGGSPANLVGLLGGDWLYIKRMERIAVMARTASERLAARGIAQPQPVSLSVALPLLKGAADEDRDVLVDLWVRLLAAAMDPRRANDLRRSYMEAVAAMDPTDALVFKNVAMSQARTAYTQGPTMRDLFSVQLALPPQEVEISFLNLVAIGCVAPRGSLHIEPADRPAPTNVTLTAKGARLYDILND